MAPQQKPPRAEKENMFLTLGIETSCDETSVALLDNHSVLASEIYTQQIHSTYGGVVPEIASRAHLQKIDRLCAAVLDTSGKKLSDIDLVAVTDGPGLAGALLVGISFALGIHRGLGTPITGVHHLEGHICSIFLEDDPPPFPFLALVVSGGHTAIYVVERFGSYECLGQTVDDAAGEAFDKVGKMLGFAYPAGRAIEQEAALAHGKPLPPFPIGRPSGKGIDFSFSGLKTAVKYQVQQLSPEQRSEQRPALCRAFQSAVTAALAGGLVEASRRTGIADIVVAGGVACNGALRAALRERFGSRARFPRPIHCTDNAAMIAWAGYERHCQGLSTFPRMAPSRPLGAHG